MDYVLSWKIPSRRSNRLTSRKPTAFRANSAALVRDLRATRTMDRTTNSATGQQFGVGGVHYGIRRDLCDVASQQTNLTVITNLERHDIVFVARQIHLKVGQTAIPCFARNENSASACR